MAESGRPSKRHRPDPVDGSGHFPVRGAGCGSTGDSSSRSDTASGRVARVAVLAQYRRWWERAGHKTRCLRTLAGHLSWVQAVAVLEGDRIVSTSNDKTLKVWSLTSGECLQTLTGHSGRVNAVAVLEGDRIVSASDDGTLRVWSLESGECVQALIGHVNFVLDVAVLGADRAVSASLDRSLKVWDLTSGDCVQTLVGHLSYTRAGLATGRPRAGGDCARADPMVADVDVGGVCGVLDSLTP